MLIVLEIERGLLTSMLTSSSRRMSRHELLHLPNLLNTRLIEQLAQYKRNPPRTIPKTLSRSTVAALITALTAVLIGLYSSIQASPFDFLPKIGNTLSASARRSTNMAWRSSGATNEALIENLARNGIIRSPRVKQAMLGVRHIRNVHILDDSN